MTAPTRATHQRSCHREGRQARGDLPVQFYGYMGTNVEATPYREIPTDGTAVLGMTYFFKIASTPKGFSSRRSWHLRGTSK